MSTRPTEPPPSAHTEEAGHDDASPDPVRATVKEIGGPAEPDPTRYGDWTVKGRCIDF